MHKAYSTRTYHRPRPRATVYRRCHRKLLLIGTRVLEIIRIVLWQKDALFLLPLTPCSEEKEQEQEQEQEEEKKKKRRHKGSTE